ncbi:MAG: hypothetical protein WC810_27985 [Janthinobacterium sp.]|jgi:hypothetical protein
MELLENATKAEIQAFYDYWAIKTEEEEHEVLLKLCLMIKEKGYSRKETEKMVKQLVKYDINIPLKYALEILPNYNWIFRDGNLYLGTQKTNKNRNLSVAK